MRRLALLTVLVASLAGAGDAAAAVVLIKPEGPDPERVRIAPTFSVRWENLTDTPQRVESLGEPDFDPLSVPASGAGERRFNRVGRYRYRLSATGQEGVVIVASAARRPRARGQGCDRTRVFRYDVTVRGAKSGSEHWLPQYELNGSYSFGYKFAVRYPAVMKVEHDCFGGIQVESNQAGTGALRSYSWSDGVVSAEPQGGSAEPCSFDAAADELTASLELRADLARGGAWSLSMNSFLTAAQADALGELLAAKRDAVCDRGELTNARVFDGFPGHGFVPIFENGYRVGPFRLNPPVLNMPGVFGWAARRNPPAAVRALAHGRSFTLNGGRKHYQGTSIQTTATADTALKLTFSRRR